jgi:hypothetical protein
MRFLRLAFTGTDSRSAGRYRWVIVWLSIGSAIAFLLLANAVRDYVFVSRVLATQQVRRQMTQLVAQVEQQLRRNDLAPDTLERALAGASRGEEAINLRSSEGVLLEHLGSSFPESPFSLDEVHNAFMRREQLYRTLSTPAGDLVAEAFPLRGSRIPAAFSGSPATEPRPLILEVALPLKDADAAVLKPIRRNLVINLAAALSLLATVLLAGSGLRSYARGRRLEEQIEIARQVQSRLLPNSTLQLPGVQISTEYKPSEVVGGDFYDVFSNEANGIAVIVGDVSGKGIPAALLMGVIHGAVRTALWQSAAESHEEESKKLNRLLCDHASGDRFASMFWCVYDQPLRSLRYVNAGHCPPFLIGKRDGKLRTTRLDKGGPVLGLLPDASYQATTVKISADDLLVVYSDGLVEAVNAAGGEYGEERLATLLHAHAEEQPQQLRQSLMSSLASFVSAKAARDDLTFAIIRF